MAQQDSIFINDEEKAFTLRHMAKPLNEFLLGVEVYLNRHRLSRSLPAHIVETYPQEHEPIEIPGVWLFCVPRKDKKSGLITSVTIGWRFHHQLTKDALSELKEMQGDVQEFRGFPISKKGFISKTFTISKYGYEEAFQEMLNAKAASLGINPAKLMLRQIRPELNFSEAVQWISNRNELSIDIIK
ncbi:hypothetical protein [Vibrio owensii]|uniref:hypothetical protein n=1 Tax=Vibrio owensii TaxID=696485 RepID=UPI0018F179AD|nr:hypothetical protein [Vibrio owensii]